MTITAKYPGICPVCGNAILRGDRIEWRRGVKPRHAECVADFQGIRYQGIPGDDGDRSRFRDPGGRSALHRGHRCFPCPTCKAENALTARDVRAGYQCDACADRDEGRSYGMEG